MLFAGDIAFKQKKIIDVLKVINNLEMKKDIREKFE